MFSFNRLPSLAILSLHHFAKPALSHIFSAVSLIIPVAKLQTLEVTPINNLAVRWRPRSQRPQVMARAGLLPHELAHLSLPLVTGHQARQETFGTGGDALTLASTAYVLRTGPWGPRGLAPR